MPKKNGAPVETDREPRHQYAALPWRRGDDGALEVLLITSRESRRWVIPKGWPIKGLNSKKSAAREAFEEAGVLGAVGKKKLGDYHYDKRLRSGRVHASTNVWATNPGGIWRARSPAHSGKRIHRSRRRNRPFLGRSCRSPPSSDWIACSRCGAIEGCRRCEPKSTR